LKKIRCYLTHFQLKKRLPNAYLQILHIDIMNSITEIINEATITGQKSVHDGNLEKQKENGT
jgi:hypothetical protein